MKKITSDQILDILPQTQCRQCGYNSCRDYAEAIIQGASINCCPTGGNIGIKRISKLTGKPYRPLNPAYGKETPRHLAFIDESLCVGCQICIKTCPVDAIIGTNGLAHAVISSHCTGCRLCIPVCPVDCIVMKNVSGNKTGWDAWSSSLASRAKDHYEKHKQRIKTLKKQKTLSVSKNNTSDKFKKELIEKAMQKAKIKASNEN